MLASHESTMGAAPLAVVVGLSAELLLSVEVPVVLLPTVLVLCVARMVWVAAVLCMMQVIDCGEMMVGWVLVAHPPVVPMVADKTQRVTGNQTGLKINPSECRSWKQIR